MGFKRGMIVGFSLVLLVGMVTTFTVAFADEEFENSIDTVYGMIQDFKYGNSGDKSGVAANEEISAVVVSDLETQVAELTARIDTLETPPKILSTELTPVTEIDCSNRNMVEAFLSGWCPHPTRNVYFIEDSRVK